MRILLLGCGLMGPAAAWNCLSDPAVDLVTLGDFDPDRLEGAKRKLTSMGAGEKLVTSPIDIFDRAATAKLIADFDVVISALPLAASAPAIRAACDASTPLVDLTRPPENEVPDLRKEVEAAGNLVVLGCGVDPGLTEIMARHLAEKMETVEEIHIKCGGLPEKPTPPLNYKIVFGGRQLPLRDEEALVVENGRLRTVPRYSKIESFEFPGIGEVEAYDEGFTPWLLELPVLKGLRHGTTRTIRWPGYTAHAKAFREIGLLGLEPVKVNGLEVAPRRFLDALLNPKVRMGECERDITLFRVEAIGETSGMPRRYKIETVVRYDEMLDLTAMARITAFPAAIVARTIARGDCKAKGLLTPEQIITGPLFEILVGELKARGISFALTEESVIPLA